MFVKVEFESGIGVFTIDPRWLPALKKYVLDLGGGWREI